MTAPNMLTGQSVIVITHDVEPELIDQCDRVLVLAPGGTMAFYGPPAPGLKYFRAKDWADVFKHFSTSPARSWAAEFRASPEFNEYIANPISGHQGQRQEVQPERQREDDARVRSRQRGMLAQALTMARRYLRVMQADRAFMLTTLLMPIVLGSVVRATPTHFGLDNSTPVGGLNVNAIQLLMILVISSVLSGTALSIREFIKERDIYERERMAGLSATAYLFSKVTVLSLISVLQAALFTIVGLLGQQVPSSGLVIPGTALIEIFVALAVLSVTSMLIGLAISTLVTKGDQAMPILVGLIILELGLSGGLYPINGGIGSVSLIAPARWGLGALASTINLNVIQSSINQGPNGQQPDALWTHNAAHWLTSVAVMVGIGIIWLIIARIRLARIGPHRRK
jgi:hypothetical protein